MKKDKKDVVVPTKGLSLQPVELLLEEQQLPEGFEAYEVQDCSLPPSPVWEHPGDYLEGKFLGKKTDVGPNSQTLYELEVQRGEKNYVVAVWGTTVLNYLMDRLAPKSGDTLAIVFKGLKPNEKGDPTKLFFVGKKK